MTSKWVRSEGSRRNRYCSQGRRMLLSSRLWDEIGRLQRLADSNMFGYI
jgi:hypothetical protein